MTTQRSNGCKLAKIRRSRGLSQLDLAVRAGVCERTVRNAEQGRAVRRVFLEYMAHALEASPDEIAAPEPRWTLDLAERIGEELRSGLTALHACPDVPSDHATRRDSASNATPGSICLTALLSEARRHGVDLPAILGSEVGARGDLWFEAPLCNEHSLALRGGVRATSQIVDASFRWALIGAVSGTSIVEIEAFCNDVRLHRRDCRYS